MYGLQGAGFGRRDSRTKRFRVGSRWVVVKIMVRFGVPIVIRHLLFRVPKKGPKY